MDTRDGKWLDNESLVDQLKEERPADLEQFSYGQRVQIGTAHFEVTKIDTRRNRLVLKAVPRSIADDAPTETMEDRMKAMRDALGAATIASVIRRHCGADTERVRRLGKILPAMLERIEWEALRDALSKDPDIQAAIDSARQENPDAG